MSESSKMGLFGSKDKNKEQKKEQSKKEDSPDRYTPYCIDSDSETYDTEALSIMDINDIIGVQSDPVGDSTLESEIAALSQIITDSKADSNQINVKSQSQNEDMADNCSITCNKDEKFDDEKIVAEKEEQVIGEPINISDTDTILESQCSIQKSMSENSELDSPVNINANSEKTDSDPAFLSNVCKVSSEEVHQDHETAPSKEMDVAETPAESLVNEILSRATVVEESRIDSKVNEQLSKDCTKDYNVKRNADTLVSMEGISGSLQLIGEAYISEDSQETSSNEIDSRKEDLLVSFTDVSPMHCIEEENNDKRMMDSSDITSVEELNDSLQHKELSEDSDVVEDVLNVDTNLISVHNEKEKIEDEIQDQSNTNLMAEDRNVHQVRDTKEVNSELDVVEEALQKEHPVLDTKEETHICEETPNSPERKDKSDTMCVEDMVLNEQIEAEVESEISENVKGETNSSVLQDICETENDHSKECNDERVTSVETVERFTKQNENSNKSEVEGINFTEVVATTVLENKSTNSLEDIEFEVTTQSKTDEVDIKEPNNEECLPESSDAVNLNDSITSINTDTFDLTNTDKILASPDIIIPEERAVNDIDSNYIENSIESELNSLNNTVKDSLGEIEKLNIESHTQMDVVNEIPIQNDKPLTPVDTTECIPEIMVSEEEKVGSTEDIVTTDKSREPIQTEVKESVDKQSEIMLNDKLQNKIEENDNDTNMEQSSADLPVEHINKTPFTEKDNKEDGSEEFVKMEIVMKINEEKYVQETCAFVDSPKLLESNRTSPFSLKKEKATEDTLIGDKTEEKCNAETTSYLNEEIINNNKDTIDKKENLNEVNDEDQIDQAKKILEKEMDLITDVDKLDLSIETCATPIEETIGKEDIKEMIEEQNVELEMKLSSPFESASTSLENILQEDKKNEDLEILVCPNNESIPILPDSSDVLMEKADVETSLNNSISENNLINILEDSSKMSDMFSEEQCQNTQEIMKSILDNECVTNVTDFKHILSPESNTKNETDDNFQQSVELPTVESESKELVEKLPEESDVLGKEIEDPIEASNLDSLEELLDLDLIPESDETTVKDGKTEREVQEQVEGIDKNVDMTELFLPRSEEISPAPQNSDYIGEVINNCLTDRRNEVETLEEGTDKVNTETHDQDKIDMNTVRKSTELLEINDNIIAASLHKNTDDIDIQKQFDVSNSLQDNDLDIGYDGNPLDSVENLGEGTCTEISQDILLESTNQNEDLNETTINMDTAQTTPDISELESAVKFLQESEEHSNDSPLVLSPKIVESVVNDISKQTDSNIFLQDEDICDDASELVVELQGITSDSISISEAEIISEAAKLENERKLAEQIKVPPSEENDIKETTEAMENNIPSMVTTNFETLSEKVCDKKGLYDMNPSSSLNGNPVNAKIADRTKMATESIPKVSILEERLKEPPKIEIPAADMTKMCDALTSTKDSLLIPKDAKMSAYQKMLESPKSIDGKEPKIMDTPKKEIEKHDFENVGSPRIILKIAKSAITECTEPRSPKSPKIRSATNSPNPEDSPGQKLGKIKLKLSRSGHPSIISNENVEDVSQWHTDSTASLSPIGMKIKLSKTGDASILLSEKHESIDDVKEMKHKFEEAKRTESPLGMKIKLSKTGDASIVQQDSKDIATKYKDKLDVQGSPKRTDSPIGMKIKLSKTGDASIIQPDKQEACEDYKDGKLKEKVEAISDPPKRTESPIGMKLKLSKSGDVSIVSPDATDEAKSKERLETSPEIPKRTDSPIGVKIKLSKTKGGASIISMDNPEEAKEKLDISDVPKRTESPLGMKIKLSKSGDASIIHSEVSDETKEVKQKEKVDSFQDTTKYTESPCGIKIKMTKHGETTVGVPEFTERHESSHDVSQRTESIGMKIKFSKFGDASIVSPDKQGQPDEHKCKEASQDLPKRTESPIGMKIKLSKTGDASIIQTEDNTNKVTGKPDMEYQKTYDTNLTGKIKAPKAIGDVPLIDPEKKEKQQKRKDTESPLEMKIKLSKTGHPTIVPCETHGDSTTHKTKEPAETSHNFAHRYKESILHKDSPLKILKTGHSSFMQSNRSELTIEPIQMQGKKMDNAMELSSKRKEITISPIEVKKSKLEAQLSQILPEVTIQPVMSRDQKQLLFDPKTSLISRQQMNVISQEISITQVRPPKQPDVSMSDKLKDMLCKNVSSPSISSDCEIIEHRPELIIVNENSNSSQDVVIIEEVPPIRMPEVKIPKKRGRPRRNPLPPQLAHTQSQLLIPRDPLALDEMPHVVQLEHRENERPRRTCRNQKSYAPPKRGRGRGRGKRKLDNTDLSLSKKPRVEQDLNAIEASTMAIITIDEPPKQQQSLRRSSELYKALKQSPIDVKSINPACKIEKQSLLTVRKDGIKQMDISKAAMSHSNINTQLESATVSGIEEDKCKMLGKSTVGATLLGCKGNDRETVLLADIIPDKEQKNIDKGLTDKIVEKTGENKEMLIPPGHPNWLTPTTKRPMESASKNEAVPSLQVIDEETRMSAESNSRSQTPARNISTQASETIVNEESQGSVLSTATTESEKVKVKNRRMEINFDPDEGPFTVDKIAEYEWPLDRKGETFMIQEQISQYLGVKSFKRKYPDLKRRMVDMEERNYLRENGLVSEAMCDMGLTAVCSSEVLDVMCSDFPDQYEEYRKHMREKQVKEHSKKQKELTAAANAERNRIDLAEMAVQSALTWNISLNKSRKENRKCSLDLQTFTIHVPKKHHKLDADRKISHYPVALIPGQYTDYYREYTPAELRYYPLNTVLYGPMRPNERKFDSQSEGSQSDSDSDTSTDDSSSTSSEGTQDTEESQSTMDDVDMEISNQKEETKLKCKMCLKTLNKHGKNEVLIQCGTCSGNVHPSCIELTLDMVPHIQSYAWQCTDCKTCAQCHDPADEDKMLFCDMCDRGYHIYCVGLRRVPVGRWHCQECAVCANCGSREPGGANSDRNSVAQWQHEYKKGDKNTRVYVSTLCVPCSKLWRKGRYCPHCNRCHTVPRLDLEANLVHCSACDKYLHLGCVETKGLVFDKKNYLCDFCAPI